MTVMTASYATSMGHPASADRATDYRASVAVTMRLRHGVSLGACPPARESTGDRRRGRLPHRSGVDIRAVGVVSRCRSLRPAAGCSTKRLISLGRCAAWLPAVVSRLEDTRSRAFPAGPGREVRRRAGRVFAARSSGAQSQRGACLRPWSSPKKAVRHRGQSHQREMASASRSPGKNRRHRPHCRGSGCRAVMLSTVLASWQVVALCF
jgi:hypothetical protein